MMAYWDHMQKKIPPTFSSKQSVSSSWLQNKVGHKQKLASFRRISVNKGEDGKTALNWIFLLIAFLICSGLGYRHF